MDKQIDVNTSVHDVVFAAFDFETTGTNPDLDQIIEIGVVLFTTSEVKEQYSTFIHPTIPVPPDAVAVHGISEKQLEDAPDIHEGIKPLLNLIEGAILVAHNIRFDFQFLNSALRRIKSPLLQGILLVDTLQLSRKSIKASSFSLPMLASCIGIDAGSSHRALDDANTCRQVLLHCIDNLAILGELALADIIV